MIKTNKKLRYILCSAALLLCIIPAVLPISGADSTASMPENFGSVYDALPDDVKELLPDGTFSDNVNEVAEAAKKMSTADYIFSVIGEITGAKLGQALRLLAQIVGLLVLSAVFGTFRTSVKSEALSRAVGYCTTCAIFAAIMDIQYRTLCGIEEFFGKLNTLMLSMIPVTGAVYAMGGNVSTAATGSSTLYAFLAVSENICSATVVPVGCVCTALALCQTLSGAVNLKGISGVIKKTYTFLLGMIMTVLVSVLGAQTAISSAADSTAARAAKIVTSSVIPVVGGSVGDTLRTVGAGMQYMRSVVGITGIIFILLLLLPTLINLLLTRLAFLLAGGAADMLGCESESKLLSELGNIYGCLCAVVSMTSVMFILALTIFIKCVSATG